MPDIKPEGYRHVVVHVGITTLQSRFDGGYNAVARVGKTLGAAIITKNEAAFAGRAWSVRMDGSTVETYHATRAAAARWVAAMAESDERIRIAVALAAEEAAKAAAPAPFSIKVSLPDGSVIVPAPVVEVEAGPFHTIGGELIDRDNPGTYGRTHDMNCPACVAGGSSFTTSPRSETYWSS